MCHLLVPTLCSLTALWSLDLISQPLQKLLAHLCAPYVVGKGKIKDLSRGSHPFRLRCA